MALHPGVYDPMAMAAWQQQQQHAGYAQAYAVAAQQNSQLALAQAVAAAQVKKKLQQDRLPVSTSSTANIDERLYRNIQESAFFKTLIQCATIEDVIQKAESAIKFVNAWGEALPAARRGQQYVVAPEKGTAHLSGMKGWVRQNEQPSPCWCLIYKMHTIGLSKDQAEVLMANDSPYVRSMGLIYFRLVLPVKDLWQWFEPHVKDNTDILLTDKPHITHTTVAQIARNLILEQKFLDTRFSRIADPILRTFREQLTNKGIDCGYNPADDRIARKTTSSTDVENRNKDKEKTPSTPLSPATVLPTSTTESFDVAASSSTSAPTEVRKRSFRADMDDSDLDRIRKDKEKDKERRDDRDRDGDRYRGSDKDRFRDGGRDRNGDRGRDRDRDGRDRDGGRDRDRNGRDRYDSRDGDRCRDRERDGRNRYEKESFAGGRQREAESEDVLQEDAEERESKRSKNDIDSTLAKLSALYGDTGTETSTPSAYKGRTLTKKDSLAGVKLTLGSKAW